MSEPERPTELQRARPQRRGGPLLLTLALLMLAAGGCGEADTTSTATDTPSGPAISIRSGTLAHYDEAGRLVWSLTAAAVHYDRGDEESRAEDARVRFVAPEATEPSQTASLTVRADRLVFEHRTRDLLLLGGVRGDGPDGLTFETDRAHWDAERRRVSGSRAVEVRREDLTMGGTGFTYDLPSRSLTLQSASLQVQLEGPR